MTTCQKLFRQEGWPLTARGERSLPPHPAARLRSDPVQGHHPHPALSQGAGPRHATEGASRNLARSLLSRGQSLVAWQPRVGSQGTWHWRELPNRSYSRLIQDR